MAEQRGNRVTRQQRGEFDGPAIAKRLAQLVDIMKTQADWTQADFARKIGIGAARLSHYLNHSYYPQIDTIARIADTLGVSLEWFVFGNGPIWEKDMHAGGGQLGTQEAMLVVAAVLEDVSEAIRTTVAPKAGKPQPDDALGARRAIEEMLTRHVEVTLGLEKRPVAS